MAVDWNVSNYVQAYLFVCIFTADQLQIREWIVFTWQQRVQAFLLSPQPMYCVLFLLLLSRPAPLQPVAVDSFSAAGVYSALVVLRHIAEPVAYRDNSLDLNHKRSPALWHSFSLQGRFSTLIFKYTAPTPPLPPLSITLLLVLALNKLQAWVGPWM